MKSLAQDSPVVAEVVEEAHDIPLVQAEEEVEEPPCIRSFRRKRIRRAIGGIQVVQEEELDVAIGTERKAEQETVEDQDYPPLLEGTKLYVGNIPFDVDSEGLAKMFDESGVVEMVEVLSSYLFIITNLGFGNVCSFVCVCQVF